MRHLNEFAVFTEVVEAASFSGAARRLKLSKAAVSEHVSRLEQRIGARLLHRSTRKLALTEAGEACYRHSRRMLDEAEAALAAAARFHGEPVGLLRVACPETFGAMHIAPHVADFLRDHPKLSLELSEAPAHVDLIGERFDLAIRIGDLPSSGLMVRRMGFSRLVMVASPGFVAEHGEVTDIHDIEGRSAMLFAPFGWIDSWIVSGPDGVPAKVPVAVQLTSDSGSVLRGAALAGLGLALLPDWIVESDLRSGRLVHLLPGWGREGIPIQALYPGTGGASSKVRVFIDHFAQIWSGGLLSGDQAF